MISINVLLFASYADAAGVPHVRVQVPANGTVEDLVTAVRAAAPAIALPAVPVVAVNHRYAPMDAPVRERDEVALIPPVAGG